MAKTKKPNQLRKRLIASTTFPVKMVLLWGGTPQRAARAANLLLGLPPPGKSGQTRGFCLVDWEAVQPAPCVVVWVDAAGTSAETTLTAVHELAHAAVAICRYCGVSLRFEESEPFCYLLEDLLAQAMDAIFSPRGHKKNT